MCVCVCVCIIITLSTAAKMVKGSCVVVPETDASRPAAPQTLNATGRAVLCALPANVHDDPDDGVPFTTVDDHLPGAIIRIVVPLAR